MTNAEAKVALNMVPDAKDVFGRRAVTFSRLVGELRAISEAEKQLKDEKSDLNKRLMEMFTDSEHKTVMDNDARVTLVSSSSSHISKEALLEAGVAASVIVKATKVTPYQFVKITPAKEG